MPLFGKDLHTGGVNWTRPVADVSPYLVDGENEIVVEYNSALANVQLDRGVPTETQHCRNWWTDTIAYLEFGPRQAKLVPTVEMPYAADTA